MQASKTLPELEHSTTGPTFANFFLKRCSRDCAPGSRTVQCGGTPIGLQIGEMRLDMQHMARARAEFFARLADCPCSWKLAPELQAEMRGLALG